MKFVREDHCAVHFVFERLSYFAIYLVIFIISAWRGISKTYMSKKSFQNSRLPFPLQCINIALLYYMKLRLSGN